MKMAFEKVSTTGAGAMPARQVSFLNNNFGLVRLKKIQSAVLRFLFISMLILVLCIAFAAICALLFFRIETVEVQGNQIYGTSELMESADIQTGDNIYGVSQAEVSERLLASYPYLKEVYLEKKLPSDVRLIVKEETAVYYTEIAGQVFILSENLKVLEAADTLEESRVAGQALCRLEFEDVEKAVAGQKIAFWNKESYLYILSILRNFENASITQNLVSIDFTDKYALKANYENRFLVLFGNGEEMESKLSFAQKITEDFSEKESGKIDVSNPQEGFVALGDNPF